MNYCKALLLSCLIMLLTCYSAFAQDYGNEWIDFEQTYYKFKVAKDGVYRIPYELLQSQGLPAEPTAYQLFYRGQEIPMYQSETPLEEGGYFDFYGQKNDGALDSILHKLSKWQLTPDFSLFTDTSVYFLTYSEGAQGQRYASSSHEASENSLPLRSFEYTATKLAANAHFSGTPVRIAGTNNNFADFEDGEGFASGLILPGSPKTVNLATPYVDLLADKARIIAKLVGRSNDFLYIPDHHVTIGINGLFCFEINYEGYSNHIVEVPLPVSQIKNQTTLSYETIQDISENDQNSIAYTKVQYPRLFQFDQDDFFHLDLTSQECHFEVRNFGESSQLRAIDLLGGTYTDASQDLGKVSLAFADHSASAEQRSLVLYDPQAVNVLETTESRNFTDYSQTAQQGDFLLLTAEPMIGEEVNSFAQYRASSEGGNHDVVILDVEELYDQFYYGVRKHPMAINRLVNYGLENWTTAPEYLFLVGKGIDYKTSRFNNQYWNELNLVPSYGSPPSDLLLTRKSNFSYEPQLAVGRLPVQSVDDIAAYHAKVVEYEAWQNADCNATDTEWLKRSVHLVGGDNTNEENSFRGYLDKYIPIVEDTLFGAKVVGTYTQGSTSIVPQPEFQELMDEGISLITYMGHPGGEDWRFDIREPEEYNNQGKYPFINANSCFSGNIFSEQEPLMAERYILAPERGCIGYLSVVNLGFPSYLDEFNLEFYDLACNRNYDLAVGDHIKNAILEIYDGEGSSNHAIGIKRTCQSLVLAGDPAIHLYTWQQADYQLDENTVSFRPAQVNVEQDSILVDLQIYNKGRAVGDSVSVQVERLWANGQSILYTKKAPAIRFTSNFSFFIPNNDFDYSGENSLVITVDPENNIAESCEENNSYTHTFDLQSSPCADINTGIINLGEQYCILDDPVILLTEPNGINNIWISGQLSNLLQPALLSPGLHEVFYSEELDCGLSEKLYFIEIFDDVDFSILGPTEICENDTATFAVTGPTQTEGVSYEWTFGPDATPATATGIGPFEVTYASLGAKEANLEVTGDCISEDLTWMTAVEGPQPDITIYCMEATGSTITVGWEPQGLDAVFYGMKVNDNQPYHVYSATDFFKIQGLEPGTVMDIQMYVVGNSFSDGPCGIGSYSNTITCESLFCEDIELDIIGTDEYYFCMNDEAITLSGFPAGGEFDGPGMDEDVFDPVRAGIGFHYIDYYYKDSITDCQYRRTETVNVSFYPSVWIEADSTICEDGLQLLSGTPGLDSYYWEPTGDTTQQIWVNEPGIYELRAGTYERCFDQASFELTASSFNSDPIDLGPDTWVPEGGSIVIGPEVLPGEYLWSTGEITPTITITQAGTYSLIYRNENNCLSTDTIVVDLEPVNLEHSQSQEIVLYPNPGDQLLQIQSSSQIDQLIIYDSTGRMMHTIQSKHNQQQINTNHWPSGMYLIQCQSKGISKSYRWIKN